MFRKMNFWFLEFLTVLLPTILAEPFVGDYLPEWPLRYHNSQWLHKEFIIPQEDDRCLPTGDPVGHGHMDLNMEIEPCPPCHRPSIHCERKIRDRRRQQQMAPSMTVDEWLETSKIETVIKEKNRQTWTFQKCHFLNESIIDEMCTTDRLSVRAEILKNLHLNACRRYLVERALDRDRYILVTNTTDCSGVLKELLMLDNLVEDLACEYEMVLHRYDCRERWSVVWTCQDCRLAYRDWLCSVIIPYHQPNHGPLIKPCMSICEQVTQKCPHLHPYGKGPFAGEPVFLCIDPNIPFNKKITPEIPFGDPDQCYNVCDLEPCYNDQNEAPVLPDCRRRQELPEIFPETSSIVPDNFTTESGTIMSITMDTSSSSFDDLNGFLGESSSPIFDGQTTNDPIGDLSSTPSTISSDDLVEGFDDDGTTLAPGLEQTSTSQWIPGNEYYYDEPLAMLLPASGNRADSAAQLTNSQLQFSLDSIPEPLLYPVQDDEPLTVKTSEHRRHLKASANSVTTAGTVTTGKSSTVSSSGSSNKSPMSDELISSSSTMATTGDKSTVEIVESGTTITTTTVTPLIDDYQTLPPAGTEPTELGKNRKIPEKSITNEQQARFRHFNSRAKAELQHQQQKSDQKSKMASAQRRVSSSAWMSAAIPNGFNGALTPIGPRIMHLGLLLLLLLLF